MVRGIKSKRFGPYWQSMFMTAMCYQETTDHKNKLHVMKMNKYKTYYNSFRHVIPCKFCRDFINKVLMKKYPLDYSGRINLMRSLYIWKDQVNKKLISQGCTKTKPSPPFEVILKRYNKLKARCNPTVGKCV